MSGVLWIIASISRGTSVPVLKLERRIIVVYFDNGYGREWGIVVFSVLARLLRHT